MPLGLRARVAVAVFALPLVWIISTAARGQTIWTGYTKNFSKGSFTDDTLPANQDVLTPNVTLTRGSSGGLINIAAESSFDQSASPAGTEWATELNNTGLTVDAVHHADLTFTDWFDAYELSGTHGSLLVSTKAVVHLISENIYLDLQFTSWTAGNGGGFSYERAEPPATAMPTGDYNGDGKVDAADYVAWRDALGQTASPAGAGADGNANGTIDSGDYTFWRAHFGNTAPGSGSLAAADVPEPSAAMLLFSMLAAVLFSRTKTMTEST